MIRHYNVGTAILLLSLCFALSYATPNAYGQKLTLKKSLLVVDANGKKLGNVIGTQWKTQGIVGVDVALAIGKLAFALKVGRSQLFGTANLSIIFQTTNCTGPAFLLDDDGDVSESPLSPAVVDFANVAFVGDRTQRIKTADMSSWRYASDGICRLWTPELRFFVPTIQVDLNVFTPPFSVR